MPATFDTRLALVLLLALASATSSACSTVAKHESAGRPVQWAWAQRLPHLLASMVGSPFWLAGLVFDVGGIVLQVWALRYGDLSVVQPVLTASLVIALMLSHLVQHTRLRRTEIAYSLALIGGLVVFLAASGSLGPGGAEAIGRKIPGIILSAIAAALGVGCLVVARRSTRPVTRARALAVLVAILYVAMAGFIKSSTHIVSLYGWGSLATAWQPYCLVACAAGAMFCQQIAYGAAPLAQSQPVVASLDPIFALVLGVVVYGEHLRHEPMALLMEAAGLALLVGGVVGLSALAAKQEEEEKAALERAEAAAAGEA